MEIVRAWKVVTLLATNILSTWDALCVHCARRDLKPRRCYLRLCTGLVEKLSVSGGSALVTADMNLKNISARATSICFFTFAWIRHIEMHEAKNQVPI